MHCWANNRRITQGHLEQIRVAITTKRLDVVVPALISHSTTTNLTRRMGRWKRVRIRTMTNWYLLKACLYNKPLSLLLSAAFIIILVTVLSYLNATICNCMYNLILVPPRVRGTNAWSFTSLLVITRPFDHPPYLIAGLQNQDCSKGDAKLWIKNSEQYPDTSNQPFPFRSYLNKFVHLLWEFSLRASLLPVKNTLLCISWSLKCILQPLTKA